MKHTYLPFFTFFVFIRGTYDSSPWLLLLLLFVDQLVYITLCCSFVIAITQLMRLYDEHIIFFQLRLGSEHQWHVRGLLPVAVSKYEYLRVLY